MRKPSYKELVAVVAELRSEIVQLKNRIAELEGKNPTKRLDDSYSMNADQKRREDAAAAKRGSKKKHGSSGSRQKSERRGRRRTQDKVDQADQHEVVLPAGFDLSECNPVRERAVWRIRDGKATLIVYEIWRGPNGQQGQIEGVLPKSEFGFEIHVAVGYLVSMVGLSMDKVCAQLNFFWQLEISKSQADSLLSQLARHWKNEFESLCQLLAVSAVVHTDETSWSLNSVWAFLSEKARVLVFGCRKDGDTLAQLLPKDSFAGIVVSDDAAVYRGFSKAQKCWAHLIRKAIRFTLLEPKNDEYRSFLDGLMTVYGKAKRSASDKRLGDVGRSKRVSELFDALCDLCVVRCGHDADRSGFRKTETDREFDNLAYEIVRLSCDDELFTFVRYPEASGTNNEAERSLRGAAQDRRTCRTSKTLRGAQRRTILISVLESLKLHLSEFTLASVQSEMQSWWDNGESLFSGLLRECGLDPPTESRLDKLVPIPPTA